jgi:hypothetical protein
VNRNMFKETMSSLNKNSDRNKKKGLNSRVIGRS